MFYELRQDFIIFNDRCGRIRSLEISSKEFDPEENDSFPHKTWSKSFGRRWERPSGPDTREDAKRLGDGKFLEKGLRQVKWSALNI
jgi:hypothetical protein